MIFKFPILLPLLLCCCIADEIHSESFHEEVRRFLEEQNFRIGQLEMEVKQLKRKNQALSRKCSEDKPAKDFIADTKDNASKCGINSTFLIHCNRKRFVANK